MKYNQFVALLLIALISVSETANMRRVQRVTPMDELKEASQKSDFAQNLFVTINLSLQSGGKVDEVIDFVNEAHVDAIQQRNDLTASYNSESARLSEEISNIVTELSVLNGQLDIVFENIDELTTEVQNLENRLQRLINERVSVENRTQALEQARENDIEAYKKRQVRDSNTISALEEIIPALENLKDTGSAFLEKSQKDIMSALQRIPDNRPIQQLVQLSTKFNSAKLSEVIVKLAQVLESVQNSKVQDETNEDASRLRYQALSAELEALWHAKQKEVNATKTDLNSKQQSLRHNNTFRDSLTANIEQSSQLKSATENILEQTTQTYNTSVQSAQEAIDALKSALDILTENEATLESQEQAADAEQANNIGFF